MVNILFIHQSAELYGSDKTLLLLLKHLDKTNYFPIVILPFDGPLKTELEKENVKVIITPVLKLYRKMFSPRNLLQFFSDYKTGFSTLDTINKEHKIDIVYSNTLAVLLGFFYSKKRKIKHIWHVHEIIESPKLFTKSFSKLLASKSVSKIIYNSIATKVFWDQTKAIQSKGKVIWNGLEIPSKQISEIEKQNIRKTFFQSSENEIIIALVGRISRWKGQMFLLKSFYILTQNSKNIRLVIIGSTPPNQDEFLIVLNQEIQKLQLSEKVTIIAFQEEINSFWQSIDIAVVPSTEPEPFGLVAVEAMLANKPVVASNHGGLSEIIISNETGFLVEPNNQEELTNALLTLIKSEELRKKMGNNGFTRAVEVFSINNYVASIQKEFNHLS